MLLRGTRPVSLQLASCFFLAVSPKTQLQGTEHLRAHEEKWQSLRGRFKGVQTRSFHPFSEAVKGYFISFFFHLLCSNTPKALTTRCTPTKAL